MQVINEQDEEIYEMVQEFVDAFNESARLHKAITTKERLDYFIRFSGVCFAMMNREIDKLKDAQKLLKELEGGEK